MDQSLIRFSLSENLSAQHTQLTHFTRTPAQTRHRDHSFQHPLIYTEFLRYNYKFNAFHKRLSAHICGADEEGLYKAIHRAGSIPGDSQTMPKSVNNVLDHKIFLLKNQSPV